LGVAKPRLAFAAPNPSYEFSRKRKYLSRERGDVCRNVIGVTFRQAEIHFRVWPHESKNERIGLELEFAADHHKRRGIGNLITLVVIHDVTCHTAQLRQSLSCFRISCMSARNNDKVQASVADCEHLHFKPLQKE
jgi:hypothetical protein